MSKYCKPYYPQHLQYSSSSFLRHKNNPGPGQYEPRSQFDRPLHTKIQPGVSMKRKHDLDKKRLSRMKAVGPGSYDPEKMSTGSYRFSIGAALREDLFRRAPGRDSPGPAYEYKGTLNKNGCTLGSRRAIPVIKNENPGPGAHHVEKITDAKSYRFDKCERFVDKTLDKEYRSLLGPGSYKDPPSSFADIKEKPGYGCKLGIEMKGRYRPKELSDHNPGVGQYDSSYHTLSRNLKPITMKKRYKTKDPEESPGPGHYHNSSSFGKGMKTATLKSRHFDSNSHFRTGETTPGVGSYEISMNPQGPSFSLAKRHEYKKTDEYYTPAPGEYSPEKYERMGRNARQYSLKGKLPHIVSKSTSDNVGPGSYSVPSSFGNSSKGFTIGGKRKQTWI